MKTAGALHRITRKLSNGIIKRPNKDTLGLKIISELCMLMGGELHRIMRKLSSGIIKRPNKIMLWLNIISD